MAGRIPTFNDQSELPRSGSFIGQPPRRGVMIAMDVEPTKPTGDKIPRAMEFFLNPDQFDIVLEAVWTKIAIPGLSHEVQQYSHTASTPIKFTLEWSFLEAIRRMRANRSLPQEQNPLAGNSHDPFARGRELSQSRAFLYRDFLHSFTVPMEHGRAPSRCLLLWPNFLAIICVINKINFKFTRWSNRGMPMAWAADIEATEHRTVFKQRQGRSNYFTQVDQDISDSDRKLYDAQQIIELGSDILTGF